MKTVVVQRTLSVFLSLATCAGLGCSSSPSSADGGGGAGVTGSGGTVGSGGMIGSGGVLGSGGAAETGGATGRGGAGASGGAPSVGGPTGSGGVAGSGGATGQGGAGPVASIFDGKTLNGWLMSPAGSFSVNVVDGAIASTGGVRGVCYTANKYSFYRVIYTLRQVHPAGDNHSPGVLFFGTDPSKDALWGVQFALPESWGWDYRGGGSKGTGTAVGSVPNLNLKDWTRCELLVNSATGTARAACAQPVGTKAIEVLRFQDSRIPNVPSYFAIQCHTGGQLDEYKDITIEVNPTVNDLITTK